MLRAEDSHDTGHVACEVRTFGVWHSAGECVSHDKGRNVGLELSHSLLPESLPDSCTAVRTFHLLRSQVDRRSNTPAHWLDFCHTKHTKASSVARIVHRELWFTAWSVLVNALMQ